MWERKVDTWDTCAASVILKEAGGKITDFNGRAYDVAVSDVVASNSRLHDSVVETLTKAGNLKA